VLIEEELKGLRSTGSSARLNFSALEWGVRFPAHRAGTTRCWDSGSRHLLPAPVVGELGEPAAGKAAEMPRASEQTRE